MRGGRVPSHNFLFATFDGGGNLPPLLSAVGRLIERGHRVRVMSEPSNREEVELAGAKFVAYGMCTRDGPNASPCHGAASSPLAVFRIIDRLAAGPEVATAQDVFAELQASRPNVCVGSDLMFGPMIAAEAARIPLALLAVHSCPFPLPGVPPSGPGLWPAFDEAERQEQAAVATANHEWLNAALDALNIERRSLHLPPLGDMLEQVNAAQRILLATSAAFDFPAVGLPANVRYVGPELDDPPWAGPWASPWPDDDRRPLVLVAFSSLFQDQMGVVQRVIDGLGTLPVRGLVTTGPSLLPDALHVPSDVLVCRVAPHREVLRQAAVVVSHCGHGTVMKALAAKVPILCIPMRHDQFDNAARVVARGAGVALGHDADSATIAEAVRSLLSDPAYAACAERLGAAILRDAAASTLVSELEGLAAAGPISETDASSAP